jgi:hypothetical protein
MDCVRYAAVTATIGRHIWVCRCIAREYLSGTTGRSYCHHGSQCIAAHSIAE